MRSCYLYGVASVEAAKAALDARLPRFGEREWLISEPDRDYGWIRILAETDLDDADPAEAGPQIMADVSGRAPDRMADVVAFLRVLQAEIGGVLRDDAGERL